MQEFHGDAREIRPLINSAALLEALTHWEAICRPSGYPARADFDPMAIPRLLSATLLLDVMPEDRFVYRLAGAEIEKRYNINSFVGKTPQETLGAKSETVLAPYRLVRDQKCIFYRNSAEDWLEREPSYKSYQVLLLPLSDDGDCVNMILGVFDFVRR